MTRRQSAVLRNINKILYFECTQRLFLNINKIKIFKRIYTTIREKYKSNVRDLSYAYLIGLIEGDGWVSITKKGKYLTYEVGLELNIRDIQLLYKIKDALGVGSIKTRVRKNSNENEINLVRYNIRNKKHLKEIIIPILDKYPMLTNKQYDFLRFRYALLNDIKFYEDLPKYTRPKEALNSVDKILNTSYFSAWLIGFIEAEGCFSVYKPDARSVYEASFDIAQTNSFEIIQAIKSYLNISANIYKDNTNCFKLKTTSVRNIENVIKFLKNNPIRLLGNKKLQFILFLKNIRKIPKYYNKINIPAKY
jgi:LAGLIDADG endonuclease